MLEGDKWQPGKFDWKETVYKFRDSGYSVDYFIDFSVDVDLKNSSVRTIDVSRCPSYISQTQSQVRLKFKTRFF